MSSCMTDPVPVTVPPVATNVAVSSAPGGLAAGAPSRVQLLPVPNSPLTTRQVYSAIRPLRCSIERA